MCVYIYMCMHICIYAYMYICIYVYMYTQYTPQMRIGVRASDKRAFGNSMSVHVPRFVDFTGTSLFLRMLRNRENVKTQTCGRAETQKCGGAGT